LQREISAYTTQNGKKKKASKKYEVEWIFKRNEFVASYTTQNG